MRLCARTVNWRSEPPVSKVLTIRNRLMGRLEGSKRSACGTSVGLAGLVELGKEPRCRPRGPSAAKGEDDFVGLTGRLKSCPSLDSARTEVCWPSETGHAPPIHEF